MIATRQIPYDTEERVRWRSSDDRERHLVREEMRRVVGDLHRRTSTYDQRHNYHEFNAARYLIRDCHYPRGSVVYENFRLNAEVTGEYLTRGTDLIKQAFTPRFFELHRRFVRLNEQAKLNAHVDLFAIDMRPDESRCGFFEVKNDEGDDEISRHQELLLAFVAHVCAVVPDEVLKARTPRWKVSVEVIRSMRSPTVPSIDSIAIDYVPPEN